LKSTDIANGSGPVRILPAKFYLESYSAKSNVKEFALQKEKHDHTVVTNKPAFDIMVDARSNAKNKDVLKPPTWDLNTGSVPFTLYK